MSERPEYFEKPEPSKSDASLHRNFRPVDGPAPEHEQVIGAKESEASRTGDWVDRGIQIIPLEKIDLGDSPVHGVDDFRKVPHDEMVRGVNILEKEVRPAVEKGATRDDFREIDRVRDLDSSHSTLRVYEAFYHPSQLKQERLS